MQVQGHPPTYADPLKSMTTPPNPPPDDEVPLSRLFLWAALAVVLLVGLWLYVRFGRDVTPIIGP